MWSTITVAQIRKAQRIGIACGGQEVQGDQNGLHCWYLSMNMVQNLSLSTRNCQKHCMYRSSQEARPISNEMGALQVKAWAHKPAGRPHRHTEMSRMWGRVSRCHRICWFRGRRWLCQHMSDWHWQMMNMVSSPRQQQCTSILPHTSSSFSITTTTTKWNYMSSSRGRGSQLASFNVACNSNKAGMSRESGRDKDSRTRPNNLWNTLKHIRELLKQKDEENTPRRAPNKPDTPSSETATPGNVHSFQEQCRVYTNDGINGTNISCPDSVTNTIISLF